MSKYRWTVFFVCVVIGWCISLQAACNCTEDGGVSLAPILEMKPDNFAFSALAVGQDTFRQSTLTNVGRVDLTIEKIDLKNTLGGGAFKLRKIEETFPIVLKPDESVRIWVEYAPVEAGAASGYVRIVSDAKNADENSENRIKLLASEITGGLVAEPNPVDFGSVKPGTTKTMTVKVTNQGQANAIIESAAFKVNAEKQFKLTNPPTFPVTLASGKSIELSIAYTAKTTTAEEELILTNDTAQAKFPIRIVGRLATPQIETDPAYVRFKNVKEGTTVQESFQIKNIGGLPLEIKSMKLAEGSGPFKILAAPKAPWNLESGESKEIQVEYKATSDNDVQGTIEIESNDPDKPKVQVLLFVQAEGCALISIPKKVLFVRDGRKVVKVLNRGSIECNYKGANFSAQTSKEFSFFEAPPRAQSIEPNSLLEIDVQFKDSNKQNDSGELIIESDDPKNPKLAIPVEARNIKQAPCELSISPGQVLFGFVGAGSSRKMSIELNNDGYEDCNLQQANIIVNPDQVFSLPEQIPPTGKIIPRGQTYKLQVQYTPRQGGSFYQGELELKSNDPSIPIAKIKLQGASGELCMEAIPVPLDLGSVRKGCSSLKRRLQIYNLCPKPLTVTALKFGPKTNKPHQEFFLKQSLPIPFTIQQGSSLYAEYTYVPKDLGPDQGVIQIHNNSPQSIFPVIIQGKGVTTDEQTDTFEQKGEAKADILFIIDDSNSMKDNQQSMSQNLNSFLRWATTLKVDYHMAVTTTDDDCGTKYRPDSKGICKRNSRPPIPLAGCFRGSPAFVTAQTPNPLGIMSNNIKVGLQGSGKEKGIETSYKAFQKRQLATCNKGFLRKDASLSLIFVSDEPDSSPKEVDFYVNFFRGLKGNRLSQVRASSIVGPPSTDGCQPRSGTKVKPAPDYWDISVKLNGIQASICDANWSTTLSRLGVVTFGAKSQFDLTRAAEPGTIQVKVDGKPIAPSNSNGWSFDATTNSVLFAAPAIPPAGSKIEVTYKARCIAP